MTPLFHQMLKQSIVRRKDRAMKDEAGILGRLDDVHCFNVSAVLQAASRLAIDIDQRPQKCGRLAFLPAPRTWIEFALGGDERIAFYIEQHGTEAHVAGISGDASGMETRWMFRLPLAWPEDVSGWSEIDWGWNVDDGMDTPAEWNEAAKTICVIYALLAMINTPRIVGRRQHLPHAGLQRALARAKGMVGKFPYRATTEILLEVSPPISLFGDPIRESRLSGGKALHWVRTHLRIRNGGLELVSSHWRGDPALGVKSSRYNVIPPRNGIWPALIA